MKRSGLARKIAARWKPWRIDLARSLHGHAVYFVLREPLRRDQFDRISGLLETHAGGASGGSVDQHWTRLQERLTGRQPRWSVLVPAYDGPMKTAEDGARLRASWHNVSNIVASRGYRSHSVDGITYTLDYFNPGNELQLDYRGAGEHVLTLVLQGGETIPPGTGGVDLQRGLNRIDSFFEIVRWVDRILEPLSIVGTNSLGSVLMAYREGRIDPGVRPWEFFYPLAVLPLPENLDLKALGGTLPLVIPGVKLLPRTFTLGRVEGWSGGRVMVLSETGFSMAIGNVLTAVATVFRRVTSYPTLSPVYTFHRGPDGRLAAKRHRGSQVREPQEGLA